MFESISAFILDNASWISTCMTLMAVTIFVTQIYTQRSTRRMLEDEIGYDEYDTLTVCSD